MLILDLSIEQKYQILGSLNISSFCCTLKQVCTSKYLIPLGWLTDVELRWIQTSRNNSKPMECVYDNPRCY